MRTLFVALAAGMLLLACSEAPEPKSETKPEQTRQTAAPEPKKITIDAPAGQYKLDPDHANLSFAISHLDLSNYIARFTDFDVTLELDPEDLSASSVQVSVDPVSVETDYAGDYKAGHEDSPFESWNEDLAQSPKFFNAGEYPAVTFESTNVEPTAAGTLKVDGNLTMLGQTRPLTLDVEVTGDMAQHPFIGVGALGFSATGTLKRSDFGMTHLLDPPLVGDEVTVRFNGELHQVVEEPAEETAPEENGSEESSPDESAY